MAYFFEGKLFSVCLLILGAMFLISVRYLAWQYLPKGRLRKILLSSDKPLPPHPND